MKSLGGVFSETAKYTKLSGGGNSCPFDSKAFNEAFEEFAHYITKGKRGHD
jgi:hypothetical protein